ncbi:hypothetical protein L914_03136 [Phytophthora nicotianae]|uniref:Uncharacterized protein n=2 Tax=Phytophthora nicotianae TaxID=4792 RepID=V9FQT0_PHYNI|nr:hypothetical protein F443_03285 [Phytophthora nicotianae P1569]ETM53377.1 hypothetical protein L914_03136 [Phytophthora nicotianae]
MSALFNSSVPSVRPIHYNPSVCRVPYAAFLSLFLFGCSAPIPNLIASQRATSKSLASRGATSKTCVSQPNFQA